MNLNFFGNQNALNGDIKKKKNLITLGTRVKKLQKQYRNKKDEALWNI